MRLANSQVAYDADQTAFETFIQLESVDLSKNIPEQQTSMFSIESFYQGHHSSILDDIQKSESCTAPKSIANQ